MAATSESNHRGDLNSERGEKLFLSYRQKKSAADARLLYEGLSKHFGAGNVFFDVETLGAGVEWLRETTEWGASCGVFLIVIGDGWLESIYERGSRDTPDFVVGEVELALSKGSSLQLIPVLINGAQMPLARDLPPSIRQMAPMNAVELHYKSWPRDLEQLIAKIESSLQNEGTGIDNSKAVGTSTEDRAATLVPEGPDPGPRERITARGIDGRHIDRVLRHLRDATLVPILGPGVNSTNRREPWEEGCGMLPDSSELAGALARRFELQRPPLDLPETAQSVLVQEGEAKLFETLGNFLEGGECHPGPVPEFLARLPGLMRNRGYDVCHQMIVTTNYDNSLERAFTEMREKFDVALYAAAGPHAGKFVHLPADSPEPVPILIPNTYPGFPFVKGVLMHTLIVKVYGAVENAEQGYSWPNNYVVTEDSYIDYLSGVPASSLVPMEILKTLKRGHCLFMGFPIRDWSLRVFLKRIWEGERFQGPSFAVTRQLDSVEMDLWRECSVEAVEAPLDAYVGGLAARLGKLETAAQST
jgi:hypothetical protein